MTEFNIITICYNDLNGLIKTINSVKSQTFKNYKHIIVDGDSNDGTKEFLNSIKDLFYISEKDNGIYNAFNKGLSYVDGNYYTFLNANDEFSDDRVLERIYNEKEIFKPDIIYTDLVYINDSNSKIIRKWVAGEFASNKLKYGWMFPHPTMFIKKDFANLQFDENYKISGDYDWTLRLLKLASNIKYLNFVTIKMRLGGQSNKSLKNLLLKSFEDFQIIRKNKIGNIFTLILKNILKIKQFFT